MNKNILFIIVFIILSQCSLDNKTGFWTKEKIIEKNQNIEEIFKTKEILEKEFNPNLKIKLNSKYTKQPFINNLTNNTGYINFSSNFEKIFKFKFKKIKRFDFINPDLLIGNDKSIVFFDDKGAILKFNQNSKLMWKQNHYDKKQIKLNPSIYFALNEKILIAGDSLANIYALDYLTGNLLWKNLNKVPFNSEIKIVNDKIFIIDFDNHIRCISTKNGDEIWNFGTEKSFIKSQRKLSLVVENKKVIFIDTFGDISALDVNTGRLLWQFQTTNEDIFESSFLLKSSRLVSDNETIYVSNNQNKFFALDARNGQIKWEQSINSYLAPIIIENLIFTISNEGFLIILNKDNGNILRSTNIFDKIKNEKIYPTGFILAKKYIFVTLSNGRILKVGIHDGKTMDILKIDGGKISRPYILDKHMYVLRDNAIIKVE